MREYSRKDLVLFIVILTLILVLPLMTGSSYILILALLSYLFGVLVAIYDLFYVRTGYLNLGYTYIIASCGFAAAIAINRSTDMLWPLLAVSLAIALSLPMLIPALRLRGPFYSVSTLLFPFALPPIARLFPDVFGGDAGLYVKPVFEDFRVLYYSAISLGASVVALLMFIASTRLGIYFLMIRDDETLAESSGVRILRIKILLFLISVLMTVSVMFFYIQASGVVSVELSDPVPILIYTLMASAVYRPGSSLYSLISGIALWWLDGLMRAYIYDLRLIIASTLLLSVYLVKGVGIGVRAKIY
ncbi:MAG: hypothetical protein RQ885_11175 [Desulfurococcales archaeon]|jgi:branched-chain amino acid transport system permease protein|nr:hypothetical protein [Desulfurococcales archaeon]